MVAPVTAGPGVTSMRTALREHRPDRRRRRVEGRAALGRDRRRRQLHRVEPPLVAAHEQVHARIRARQRRRKRRHPQRVAARRRHVALGARLRRACPRVVGRQPFGVRVVEREREPGVQPAASSRLRSGLSTSWHWPHSSELAVHAIAGGRVRRTVGVVVGAVAHVARIPEQPRIADVGRLRIQRGDAGDHHVLVREGGQSDRRVDRSVAGLAVDALVVVRVQRGADARGVAFHEALRRVAAQAIGARAGRRPAPRRSAPPGTAGRGWRWPSSSPTTCPRGETCCRRRRCRRRGSCCTCWRRRRAACRLPGRPVASPRQRPRGPPRARRVRPPPSLRRRQARAPPPAVGRLRHRIRPTR